MTDPLEGQRVPGLAELMGLVLAQPARPFTGTAAATPSQPELKRLTEAVRAGDEQAFTQFYALYSFELYKYLLVLARGHELDAREVFQTVVIKAARRFEVFHHERHLLAWLRRLARNAYIDLCRAQQRNQKFVPLEEHTAELFEPAAAKSLLLASFNLAFAELPEPDKELMRAAYLDRRPLQELANESQQTYKALESRLGRLRQKLRTKVLASLENETAGS